MNRPLPLLLIAAALFATGCDRETAAPATADAPAADAAAPADAAPPAAVDAPAPEMPEDLAPLTLPEPVIDTTPVDTTITAIDTSNEASETELTGALSSDFGPQDSVFMAIRTNGTAEKYTISSKWYYPDGQVITENSQIVSGAGPSSTIFSMSKPDGWAPGTYKVEYSINGKLMQTKEFVVR